MCSQLRYPETIQLVAFYKEKNAMKKLMSLMLGLALVSGSVVVIFAQDAPKKEEEGKKKKGKKKGGEEPKKETR
jgi:hypothetical protein